ncbi:MAG: response regulator [Desulfobacterales bacterium]|nr:response regulator [Desulfobacterales bacterium]
MEHNHILIVDDEERVLSTSSKLLSQKGFQVSTASNAKEALALIGQKAIHVVVMDIKMPGMDGIEALKIIKQQYPLIEVIMLTGHATVETAIEGLQSGAFDFLIKPADIDELAQAISRASEKRDQIETKIRMAQTKHYMKSPREIIKSTSS